jgi:hypothetical protein
VKSYSKILSKQTFIKKHKITKTLVLTSILILFFVLSSCGGRDYIQSEKITPPLKQKLNTALEKNDSTPIQFTGRCTEEIDEEIKSQITSEGITVYTIAGDIFSGMGTPHSIIELAKLPVITHLEANSNFELKE